MSYGLGRIRVPDERDANFPMSAALKADKSDRKFRYWNQEGWWGHQGNFPHCVGYAWTAWVEDGPVTHPGKAPIVDPSQVYHEAQLVDQWPGENYDGTSVRAGAKVLQSKGLISGYSWAWDAETVAQAILTTGPVVVGTAWYTHMFIPDMETHTIRVAGEMVGGHAYLVNGYNSETRMFRIKNSWGRDWGKGGHAHLTFEDLDFLIKYYGEACLATEISTKKTPAAVAADEAPVATSEKEEPQEAPAPKKRARPKKAE